MSFEGHKYLVIAVSMYVFMPVSHSFNYYSFVVGFEIRKYESSNCVLFFSRLLAIQCPLRFHMNFRTGFLISAKFIVEILIKIVLNL